MAGRVKKFNSDEVAMFCDQIAMLMNGGIPLYEGTYILYSEMEDPQTREVLKKIDDEVHNNVPLYIALENTGAFPEYMVHMVCVGERTGRIEDVMRSLAEYYERDSRVKAGIKNAIAYPVLLFSVMAVIFVALAWKILPMFERMFEELSTEVADSTENALAVGLTAGRGIAIALCVILAVAFVLIIWSKTKTGHKVLAKFFESFGVTKKLSILMATGKFVSAISLMLSSGMDISEGLEREAQSCDNDIVRGRIVKALELSQANLPFDEAIRQSELIVGMESRLISVAAKTGETDKIFAKLSNQYNERISEALGKFTTVIETLLVVILSLMIGAVLLTVMIPLVSIISSIG